MFTNTQAHANALRVLKSEENAIDHESFGRFAKHGRGKGGENNRGVVLSRTRGTTRGGCCSLKNAENNRGRVDVLSEGGGCCSQEKGKQQGRNKKGTGGWSLSSTLVRSIVRERRAT